MSGDDETRAREKLNTADSMPAPRSEQEDDSGMAGAAGSSNSLADVMLLLTKLIQTMPAQLATAVNADKFTHVDKAKLDINNFIRIKTFTNKHSEWKEWKNQFSYAVAECDSSFAKTLTGMEKNEQPIVALTDLNPTQAQLSAILFNRLQAVTTGTANTMVMSTEGNGCEAWRLLNKFFDPQTDQRLTKSIMEVINYKVRGKDIQAGIIDWEQQVSSLTKDHGINLDPKLLRALLMNIMPKWMSDKILEHLDRLPSYGEVREKIISSQPGPRFGVEYPAG